MSPQEIARTKMMPLAEISLRMKTMQLSDRHALSVRLAVAQSLVTFFSRLHGSE